MNTREELTHCILTVNNISGAWNLSLPSVTINSSPDLSVKLLVVVILASSWSPSRNLSYRHGEARVVEDHPEKKEGIYCKSKRKTTS